MATRWRVLNRRRARKARSANQPEWVRRFEETSQCDHQWEEEYYGHRCKKCDLFYPHGGAPWDYYGDEPGTDYVAAWLDDPYEGEDEQDHYDEEDEWECEFGAHCLMPSFHHRRSECYTVEMAEAWADEAARNS